MDGATSSAGDSEFTYEFVPGYRKNSKLLYVKEEKQLYYFNVKVKDSYSYTCYLKNCNRRVHIRDGKCFAVSKLHNHSNQAGLYTDLRALNEMKRMAGNIDNRLKVREIFDTVKARYSNCTLVFKKHERTLQILRANVMKKETQIVSAGNNEPTLANSTANDIIIDDSGPLVFEDIEMVEMTPSDKSTHDSIRADISIENTSSNDVFDKTVKPVTESTVMEITSIQASTTCARMKEAATDLRNNRVSKALGNKSIVDQIDTYWTLPSSNLQFKYEEDSVDWSLYSSPQRTMLEVDRTIPPKSNSRLGLPTTSDISDEPIAQSTAIEHSSFEASTTCARIEKAAHDLREPQNFDTEIPTTSKDNLHLMYIRESDLNRLIKIGYVSFVNGKLHYNEPKLY